MSQHNIETTQVGAGLSPEIHQTVLGKIVDAKIEWVQARQQSEPLDSFIGQLTPSDRDFTAALQSDRCAFILECKKASPSKGLIRDDFDPASIAKIYGRYASAISVLTDEPYFQGDMRFLPQVRGQVSVPVLCKDFMIDPYQVYLARHYGADAILLMLSVLQDSQYQKLAEVAQALNLGILTEVSTPQELERAIALKAKVIGINNRNLRDLSIDLNRTKTLAPQIPKGTVIISESGIYTHQQVRDLAQYAHGFLVGSSLMAQHDIERAVKGLILGHNKVCGLTRTQDAKAAFDAGAIYGGLIFAERSPRKVTLEQAKVVQSGAPLAYVGVFQNQSEAIVVETAQALNLAAVQLHGQEDSQTMARIKAKLPTGCELWRVQNADETLDAPVAGADRYLFDRKQGQTQGGTGQAFDWQLLHQQPNTLASNLLAGGIAPNNAQAASQIGCFGLDINSGAESAPGLKDDAKLQAIFAAIRNYAGPIKE
ncbi:Tryptophan biosynthesis protein TrpCF [Vibrio stylophorae]|uniref:Multifunctional fusion protein n=1 Tax=Vibrio stylophorae TaxID=659351 RepID=A0ABM8ZRR1_9VIBR|nr:bifunctional indole-3-glycerol-phosphate synthase TrpC/phosphoribosylanthranilate isomerase TrpF [Vibrio stylophorae]CAH0532982.1 Tryptophan biosynthesis protein TrpCF [Vibrio stylophorae]